MADAEEKHILHKEPFTHMGKMVWMLKIYYPNQGGVVKTIYAPEQEGVIDLTQAPVSVEPLPQPVEQPQEAQVTEDAVQPQQ